MALSILLAITVFAQCTPVQSIWDSRVPSNGCSLNLTIMATIMCGMLCFSPSIHDLPSSLSNIYLAWSAVLDFVLALFPWVALWNLNMKKKEKYTICLSLSLGILLVFLSQLLPYYNTNTLSQRRNLRRNPNNGSRRFNSINRLSLCVSESFIYFPKPANVRIDATTDSVMWTMSELTTTIICVSIPALRPLYRSIRGNLSSNDASNYNDLPPYAKSSGGRSGGRNAKPTFAMDTVTTTTVHGKDIDSDSRGSGGNEGHGEDTDTRHILQHPPPHSTGIYQVNEVTVSYEDRRPGDVTPGDDIPIPVKARQHI